MKHPIRDKAQVSIDFPEKFYVGSFGRDSSLDVSADDEGVHIYLERQVDKKRRVGFHLHYYLLADLLQSIAQALKCQGEIAEPQKSALAEATGKLAQSLVPARRKTAKKPHRRS